MNDELARQLADADQLAAISRDEAISRYQAVLAGDPANLHAHNALERLGAPWSYGSWMHVNCVIDPRDDIFRFFASHPLARNPLREYLSDGWRTLAELMTVMERLSSPLLQQQEVLEFAAGFGRFTRHLSHLLPGRVSCTEVQPGSLEFLAREFGVETFPSSFDPAELRYPRRFDLIFVLSLFTHLPPAHWAPWLKHLHRGLKPGGHLVLTVHNEDFGKREGVALDDAGVRFFPSSESPQLGEAYGTTYTSERFTLDTVERALGHPPKAYFRQAFWVGQDAVVIGA